MYFRLRTSVKTGNDLKFLQDATKLTPNILARLAIALSLRDPNPVDDLQTNNNGLEFMRSTLTGNHDVIYRSMVAQHCGRRLTDEEYFPHYIKLHLDRGCTMLMNEYKYAGNYERMIYNLVNGK